jgi:hypothetical protein
LLGVNKPKPGLGVQQMAEDLFQRIKLNSREFSQESREHKRYLDRYKH